jgi:hypothetical protein
LAFDFLPLFALILVAVTSIILFIASDWRLSILTFAFQYLGVFLLVLIQWPMTMAVVKLVAGWMSGAVLGMAMVSIPELHDDTEPEMSKRLVISPPFYLLAAILVGMVVISQVDQVLRWFPNLRPEQATGGLLLVGMGLFKLGFTTRPLQATLGILTALSGFEIIYATIETSALLAGLLASITLGLALAGAYLLAAPHLEEM